MNWYLVKMVYKFLYAGAGNKQQFSEQVRLINAEDGLHAFYKARLVGEKEAMQAANHLITWKFIDVIEILPLQQAADGAEVWSCINEEENPELYVRSIHTQSKALLQDSIGYFFN
ncbi:MAG TPA: DUF4288 domain-containing protein [Ferruginibacter sp.]|nr:DUF4288 domain-containing protein [Ferruginibacter sp.]HMP20410.1 DUF4288 domain-containing protein [Ferruginibacter sp.]